MRPASESLIMWGQPSEGDSLDWPWAEMQLIGADAYWLVTAGVNQPHPRPVWGVWHDDVLALSVGSPSLSATLGRDSPVAVHLGSVTDVVIVEGRSAGPSRDETLIRLYDEKYDWHYSVDEYGALTIIEPQKVIAWQAMGSAGRDGFRATGRWTFPPGRV